MAPQKRRAPEPKRRPLRALLLSSTAIALGRLAAGLGRLMANHPKPVFGTLGFAAIFSAIAANALWYQPHRLATPFMVTRNLADFDALPGVRPTPVDPADVTTFKIEREEPGVVVEDETVAAADSAPALPGGTNRAPRQPENVALAVAVQQALIARGLYDGVADGVIGPRTAAAILFFQQTAGLPETGEVSEDLLKSLAADGSLARRAADASPASAAVPEVEEDPVAATIRTANIPAPAKKPRPPATTASADPAPVVEASSSGDALGDLIRSDGTGSPSADLVIRIQQGLARMQYRDVTPDGVLGDETRAAIIKFEKDYGLPQTGEASERVLNKLREIGMV